MRLVIKGIFGDVYWQDLGVMEKIIIVFLTLQAFSLGFVVSGICVGWLPL